METQTPYELGAQSSGNATNPFPKDSNEAKWFDDGRIYAKLHSEHPENYLPKNEPSAPFVTALPAGNVAEAAVEPTVEHHAEEE